MMVFESTRPMLSVSLPSSGACVHDIRMRLLNFVKEHHGVGLSRTCSSMLPSS